MGKDITAKISINNLECDEAGHFEIIFDVKTPGCVQSDCNGFYATFVFSDGSEFLYSFGGWSIGETNSESFQIRKTGVASKQVASVKDIENPIAICHQ